MKKGRKLFAVLLVAVLLVATMIGSVMPVGAATAYEKKADIDSVEDAGVWGDASGGHPTLKSVGSRTGNYLETTAVDGGGNAVFMRGFEAVDLSAYQTTGYLHMWLYVAAGTTHNGGFVDVSSGNVDTASQRIPFAASDLSEGWNELYLKLSDGTACGTPVFSAINTIRIVIFAAEGTKTLGIDDLYVCVEKAAGEPGEPSAPAEPTYGAKYDLSVGAQVQSGAGDLVIVKFYETANDLSNYASEGILHIKLYVDDASKLVGGQLELSSSGTADQNELSWNLADLGLEDGWNELYLPVSTGHAEGGAIDFSKMNFFRVYALQEAGSTMELRTDDVYMCLEGAGADVIPTGVNSLFVWIMMAGFGMASLVLVSLAIRAKKKVS